LQNSLILMDDLNQKLDYLNNSMSFEARKKLFSFFEKISIDLVKKQEIELNDGKKIISIPAIEYYLCKNDIYYFLNNYCKVLHPVKGIIPYKIYKAQVKLVDALLNKKFVITLKTRQAGFSTTLALISLHTINFFSAKTIECFSISEDESIIVFNKLKFAFDNLPVWLKTATLHDTSTSISNVLSSSFTAKTSTPNKGSGSSLSLLILDEASKIQHIEKMWNAIYPTISTGGKVVVNSTPNGLGNWYAKKYLAAVKGENEFTPVFVQWWEIPERDNEWLEQVEKNDFSFLPKGMRFEEFIELEEKKNNIWVRQQVENLGSWDAFCQEYKGEFLGTGRTVLTTETLNRLQEETNRTIILEKDRIPKSNIIINSLEIYNYVNPKYDYVIFTDISTGRGADFSAVHVFNLNTKEQDAEIYVKVQPYELAKYIKQIATYYNNAYVLVESNAVGLTTLTALLNEEDKTTYYNNVYVEYINNGMKAIELNEKLREENIYFLVNALENNNIKINSKRLVSELLTFIWRQKRLKQKPEAEEGCHDDLILALSQLGYFYNYVWGKFYNSNLGVINYFDNTKKDINNFDNYFVDEQKDEFVEFIKQDINNQLEFADDDKKEYILQKVKEMFENEKK